MYINNEINLLQDLLKKNEKIQNQFQNGLVRIGKIQLKKGQKTNLFQTRKIQNIVRNIFQNKVKQIKKKYQSTIKYTCKCEKKKSKQSIAELFNNNNNNNNNNLCDNKINDIRRIVSRLRDISPKKDRKEIKDKLYKIEHQRNLSEEEKEENDEYLRKLVRILNNKEKHSPYDCDDLVYYRIRDIENLFDEASEEDYYKSILVKSSFKGNYKYYESRGDKEKRLSVKQYLNKITPYLYDLINDHRIARRVWKIQINMKVNFISSKDTGEARTIYT